MLRQTFLYLSDNRGLRHWMENSSVSHRLTSRFVAGRELSDAVGLVQKLSAEKMAATLDFLGENVTSLCEAAASRQAYLSALAEIERNRLPATVSIKLTQFGLDFSESACLANVVPLLESAVRIGTRVEIDMESSAYTDRTLSIVRELQSRFGDHVRAVIQAYLYRSEADIESLSRERIPVRLCKGAYGEPATVAFPRKSDVDANFRMLMKALLKGGAYPAIATHDEAIIRHALQHIREQRITPDRFEFQMLYGIRRDLQREIVSEGFRLRLYVPYGDAWYPYFMRRLAERPANLLFLARSLLKK